MIRLAKVVHHIIAIIVSIIMVVIVIIGVNYYKISHTAMSNVLGFIGCFWGLGACALGIGWKYRPLRWYLIGALVIIVAFSGERYFSGMEYTDTDFSNYLTGNAAFEKTAQLFLPEREALSTDDVIEYMHRKSNSSVEYIYLSIQYEEASFSKVAQQEYQKFVNNLSIYSGAPYFAKLDNSFTLGGHEFHCFLVRDGKKEYGMAYSQCHDSNVLIYLFLTDPQLEYMSIREALCTYGLTLYPH